MYPDFSGPFVIRTRPELRLDTPGSQRWAQNDLCFVNGTSCQGVLGSIPNSVNGCAILLPEPIDAKYSIGVGDMADLA